MSLKLKDVNVLHTFPLSEGGGAPTLGEVGEPGVPVGVLKTGPSFYNTSLFEITFLLVVLHFVHGDKGDADTCKYYFLITLQTTQGTFGYWCWFYWIKFLHVHPLDDDSIDQYCPSCANREENALYNNDPACSTENFVR